MPVEDGYAGIDLLLSAWTTADELFGCDNLSCLDGRE